LAGVTFADDVQSVIRAHVGDCKRHDSQTRNGRSFFCRSNCRAFDAATPLD
jgi:hypothetical protein